MKTKQLKYPKTPELDRMKAIQDKSQAIGAFIDWLQAECDVSLCERHHHSSDCDGCGFRDGELWPISQPINTILAEYFEIDLDKCEQERLAILDYIRDNPR